jgi:gliding motility-associated-like protein
MSYRRWLTTVLSIYLCLLFSSMAKAQFTTPAQPAPTVVTVNGVPLLSISYTPVVCNYYNGSIIVTATGGTPPYQFSDDGKTFQSNGSFTHLYQGNYMVVVKDANGLTNNYAINLNNSLYFGTSLTVTGYTRPTTCSAANISLTLQGYSDYALVNPLEYSMDGVNFQSSNTFSNLSAGNYTFFVMNTYGCIDSAYFSIASDCPIQASWSWSNSACTTDGYITAVNVTGGTPPYQYALNGGPFQTGNSFPGLSPGLYKVQVMDATGATMLYSLPIFKSCTIAATAVSTNASCGNQDGTLQATATGGTPPYSYSIDGTTFQASGLFTGLAPGRYSVSVNDAGGLSTTTATATIISNCPTQVSATVVNATCGGNNGQITANVTNATPPFQYSIDGTTFQTNNVFTFVPSGTYTLTAIDATGLKLTTTATVLQTPVSVLQVATLPTTCSRDDGTIIITASGVPPFQYSVDYGIDWQSSNIFTNLYTGGNGFGVYIKDGNGCVNGLAPISVLPDCITVTAVTAGTACSQNNGSITANAVQGAAPFTYSIDGVNFQSGNVFNGLAAGNYTVTAKGADGEIGATGATISSNCLVVHALGTIATCGNGSITAYASGGTPPYQYSLDGVNFTSNNYFPDLQGGTYTLTVKDAAGTIATDPARVLTLAGPQVTATATAASCQNDDGTIVPSVSGGTSPYVFSLLKDGVTSTGLTGLATGIYQLTATDAGGCPAITQVTVLLNNDLTVSAGTDQTVCEGKTVTLQATSATTSFSWTPSTGLSDPNIANPVATGGSDIQYMVTASLGPCTAQSTVIVNVLPAPVPVVSPDTTVCYGKSVQLSGSGGVSYSWTPATFLDNSASADPTVVHPDASVTYSLSVTGANGCPSVQKAAVTVTVSAVAAVSAGNDTTIAIGEPLQLDAVDVNNTGFTQYVWSPSTGLNDPDVAMPVAVLNEDMTYTVMASTPEGCEAVATVQVKVYAGPDIYVPNAFTPNGDGHNDVIRAIPVGIRDFKYFNIYNRYGQMVFSTTDPSKGWDGVMGGKPQPTATFVWQAEGVDYKGNPVRRKGFVILVR